MAEQEEFEFISVEEFDKRSIRTRIDPAIYAKYANAIQQIKDGGACHVKTTTYKSSKKNLLKVAKQMDISLTVEKTMEGMEFKKATEDEMEKRRERGQKLVEARQGKGRRRRS